VEEQLIGEPTDGDPPVPEVLKVTETGVLYINFD
jgi:hypothetical protein